MNISGEFGPGLKALRERRGITLEAIATATKIGRPLLDGLEHNDLSHWPKGIFRRAFFRDYASAIGAPVDDTLAEFLRLFPEDGCATGVNEPAAPLRLTFAPGRSRAWRRTTRAGTGLLEAFAVISIGLAAAWCLGVEPSDAIAAVTLVYYPLTTAWLGRSLAMSWLNDRQRIPAAWSTARASSRFPAPVELQPERRATVDDRAAVGADEPEVEPFASALHLRKGSAA
jgi:cytoskeletal protein RodZ